MSKMDGVEDRSKERERTDRRGADWPPGATASTGERQVTSHPSLAFVLVPLSHLSQKKDVLWQTGLDQSQVSLQAKVLSLGIWRLFTPSSLYCHGNRGAAEATKDKGGRKELKIGQNEGLVEEKEDLFRGCIWGG